MIPHHAGAILMWEQAPLHDSEIKVLCKNIVSGQQAWGPPLRRLRREADDNQSSYDSDAGANKVRQTRPLPLCQPQPH
jgi:hypothetical protein